MQRRSCADKGTYIGTRLLLSFRAQRTIRYVARVQNSDADLEAVRDQIAARIADRMLDSLRAGQVVSWMPDVDFLPAGLRFRRAKILGMALGPVEIMPYAQIQGTNLKDGVFYLYSNTEAKPVFIKPTNSPNFFPGRIVVLWLLDVSRSATTAEAASTGETTTLPLFQSPIYRGSKPTPRVGLLRYPNYSSRVVTSQKPDAA